MKLPTLKKYLHHELQCSLPTTLAENYPSWQERWRRLSRPRLLIQICCWFREEETWWFFSLLIYQLLFYQITWAFCLVWRPTGPIRCKGGREESVQILSKRQRFQVDHTEQLEYNNLIDCCFDISWDAELHYMNITTNDDAHLNVRFRILFQRMLPSCSQAPKYKSCKYF